jgi:hypothetical protein
MRLYPSPWPCFVVVASSSSVVAASTTAAAAAVADLPRHVAVLAAAQTSGEVKGAWLVADVLTNRSQGGFETVYGVRTFYSPKCVASGRGGRGSASATASLLSTLRSTWLSQVQAARVRPVDD